MESVAIRFLFNANLNKPPLKGGSMKLGTWIMAIIVAVIFAGCSTSASFKLPPNTDLMISDERVVFQSKDDAGYPEFKRTPFFWTSLMGIDYALVQDGKIIKKDRLPARFRVVSVFFPPYALIYWPIGFKLKCYDLSDIKKEFTEECSTPEQVVPKNTSTTNTIK